MPSLELIIDSERRLVRVKRNKRGGITLKAITDDYSAPKCVASGKECRKIAAGLSEVSV
jgi:hypothetical protein